MEVGVRRVLEMGRRVGRKVCDGEKVWEDVRKGETSLEDVQYKMVGGLIRRLEGVRRFGKLLAKVRRVWRMYTDGGRTCEKVGGGEKVWEDV